MYLIDLILRPIKLHSLLISALHNFQPRPSPQQTLYQQRVVARSNINLVLLMLDGASSVVQRRQLQVYVYVVREVYFEQEVEVAFYLLVVLLVA
jgi:hypothetical protein